MPWCGFFERARRSANRFFGLPVAAVLGLGFAWMGLSGEEAWARRRPASVQASPSPSASPGVEAALAAFASLPAVEVELEAPGASAGKVGDRLELRAFGATAIEGSPISSATQLQLPPGSSPLAEQGWALFTRSRDEGRSVDDFRFIAVPLKAGDLILPSMALVDAQGKAFARTNPFRISVVSAIRADDPKPQEAEPPRPPVSLAYPWWVVILLSVLGLAVVGAGIHFLIRWSRARRQIQPGPMPAAPPLPEDEEALAALEALDREGAARRGDFKKHYFRVSEILKNYIGARYGFDAPESTTHEILVELRKQKGDRYQQEHGWEGLEQLLERLDRVKFTDHFPASGEPAEVLAEAKAFVLATRRIRGTSMETTKPL